MDVDEVDDVFVEVFVVPIVVEGKSSTKNPGNKSFTIGF